MSTAAIIPVKGHSSRLPGKNIRVFHGKPMFMHSVDHARISGLFDEIVVSTESNEVAKICETYNVKPPFMRPQHLASDSADLADVCVHVLDQMEARGRYFDSVCLLWATSPLRIPDDLIQSYSMLSEDVPGVFAATQYDLSPACALTQNEFGRWVPAFPELMWKTSQELPEFLVDSGSFAWVKSRALRETGSWMPPGSIPYAMPRSRSVDIDTPEDWEYADYLYAQKMKK